MSRRFLLPATILIAFLWNSALATTEIDVARLPAPASGTVDFTVQVQPILVRSCLRCHNAETSMSQFRLDNKTDALRGGDQGIDIVPGKSAESRLIHVVARLVPNLEMPPRDQGEPLSKQEIGLLRAWIDQGARWPEALKIGVSNDRVATDGTTAQGSIAPVPPAPGSHTIDFIKDVRPILAKRCYSCHGPSQQNNQLRWDVKAAALKGGTSGPAILPGRSAESLMIRLVSGLQPGLVMPLRGDRLSAAEIGILRAWIDQGARWPDGIDPAPAAAHWAYRPLSRPALPKTQNGKLWVRTPIDQFILAKLAEKDMHPSAPADKRTLLRRVTYDLTGLPPTAEEVQNFLADNTPSAYAKVVDRLLASPRYGEHWARHWLDIVHYADSHGHDQDRPRDNAWPYRDYVIQAFNEDKPYARFVEEQLAGDVLFPDKPEGAVATGFIGSGPFDESSMISIVDDTLDKKRAQSLDRDDMVMTTMSTFISSTVHCARCHNHKFDPIPQQEYYRLQAVFAGVDRADRPYDLDPSTHLLRQSLLREKSKLEERRSKIEEAAAKIESPEVQILDTKIGNLQQALDASNKPVVPSKSVGYQSSVSSAADEKNKWVQVDLGRSLPIDEVHLVPVQFGKISGFGFPTRFRVDLSNDSLFGSYSTLADTGVVPLSQSGARAFSVTNIGRSGRYLRVTAFPSSEQETGYWFFALAELLAFSGEQNVAFGATVTASNSVESSPQWGKANLTDGYTSILNLPSSADGVSRSMELLKLIQTAGERWETELQLKSAKMERQRLATTHLSTTLQMELQELSQKLESIAQKLATLPPSQMVYAGTSDFATTGNFHPSHGVPRPIHVLKRGEVTTPAELVSPGALSMVAGLDPDLALKEACDEGARRAALAHWITSPSNSLTWRSIVNRVWHYHFGKGLVNTPNDFGRMGGIPTHPELLDWLASRFLDHGGSMKQLHRLILSSAVYLQSSMNNPDYAQIDSDNQLLWRMNRSRLDAEAIRDSVLQISGKLDLVMGGPPVKQFYYEDPNPGVTPIIDFARFDIDSPESFRRSIYRYVFRTVTDPFMDSLDCPDASQLAPVRNTSVTALQALAMWNDRLIVRQAEHFAERLDRSGGGLAGQINAACMLVWSRLPTAAEAKSLMAYASKHGMANTCRVLYNSSEFMFVN